MIKRILTTSLMIGVIGGIGIGVTKCVQNDGEKSREHARAVRKIVERSNLLLTLNFDKKDMSYEECEVHGSDLVISGTTNDGRPLVVSIFDSPNCVRSGLYALLMSGEGESRRIRFPQGNARIEIDYLIYTHAPMMYVGSIPEETYFTDKVRFGTRRADRITVLKN